MLDTKTAVDEIIQEEQISAEQSEIMQLKREALVARSYARDMEQRARTLARSMFIAVQVLERLDIVGLTHSEKRGVNKLVASLLRNTYPLEQLAELPFNDDSGIPF